MNFFSSSGKDQPLKPDEDKLRPTLNISHFRNDQIFENILNEPVEQARGFASLWPNDSIMVGANYYDGRIMIDIFTSENRLSEDRSSLFINKFRTILQSLIDEVETDIEKKAS